MASYWQALFANFALSTVVATVWMQLADPLARATPRHRALAFGTVMGLGAVAAMLMPLEYQPGLLFDVRAALVAAAAFFGGVLAALVAAALALAYRLWCGGMGMWAGAAGILLTAGAALACRALLRGRAPRYRDVVALAVLSTGANFLAFFVLPVAVWMQVVPRIAAPFSVIVLASTLLVGAVMLQERRRRDLLNANALYRSMVEALPDCLNAKDLDGRFLVANEATARLMRAGSGRNLIGRTDFDYYPTHMAAQFRAQEEAIQAHATPVTIDEAVVFADGTQGWLTTLKAPLRDAEGRVAGVITHNRDISSRMVLQMELDTARQYLELALANMGDGLVLFDADRRILFCNARYRELFPVTADLRVPGTAFGDLVRAALARGEERLAPSQDAETVIAARVRALDVPGDRLVHLGDGRWMEFRTQTLAEGRTLLVVADVTQRKTLERDLRRRALHDSLTGLANRELFQRQLTQEYARAKANGTDLAVMLLDLDRFKAVNDTHGHAVGDTLLVEVARRVEGAVRKGDLVARLGGDEFAILAPGRDMKAGAVLLAERILALLAAPVVVGPVELRPAASLGLTVFPHDAAHPEGLMVDADKALYAAKAQGRGTFAVFAPERSAA